MDDSEIIRLYQARDERAVSALRDKFGAYCLTIARNILKNEEDAADCVNTVYLKVWESIPPNEPSNLAAFVGKLAKNHALNLLKAQNREKRGKGAVEPVYEELEEVISDASSVEGELERKELLAVINRFLKHSPTKTRKAFVMRYWYCYDIPDIARQLGMTENNTSVTLSRARKRLKEILRKEGFDV